MARRGFEVVAIIDASDGDLSARLEAGRIRHYKVPLYLGRNLDRSRLLLYLIVLPFTIVRIATLLRKERIDIAHSHIFVANFVTRLACLLTGTRHVAGIVGPRHLESGVTRAADRLTWRADAAIVAGCEHTASLYRQIGTPDERITCIYYGSPIDRVHPAAIDRNAFRRELGISSDTPLVGLVAHFYPPMRGRQAPPSTRGRSIKGQETFVEAARIVARHIPDARFVLVGSGFNPLGEQFRQSLIDSCRADGLIEKIFFPGHRRDLEQVLVSLDVAVQCPHSECLGGTVEALLMERPFVGTNVGGIPEAVHHEKTGLVVPPGDAAALAASIERLLTNRGDAQCFARAGRALMLERFTFSRTADDLTALYRRVAAEPSR